MTIRSTLLAATMLVLPVAAQAQPVNGLYVAGGLGWNWHGNISETFMSPGTFGTVSPVDMRVGMSTGSAIAASLGWGIPLGATMGLRVEAEYSYRSNSVNSVELGGVPAARSGRITTSAVMANLLFDMQLGPVMPYIGGGIGYAWNSWSNVGGAQDSFISSYDARFGGDQGGFAYQAILGLAVPLPWVRGLAVTAEYRYFAAQSQRYSGQVAGDGFFGFFGGPTSISAPNTNQSLLFGVRYNF